MSSCNSGNSGTNLKWSGGGGGGRERERELGIIHTCNAMRYKPAFIATI